MAPRINSWGRWPRVEHTLIARAQYRDAVLPATSATSLLPHGNGRSYGDVCLNEGGAVLLTRGLDRYIRLDPASGLLECEAGVLLSDIIDLVLPYGWFPAVTPGTAQITVGGAIANDVHGKNHHRAGSFSDHVVEFELLRSDGDRFLCSPTLNPAWFRATVGGLGLTGLITRATLRLRRVRGPWFHGDSQRFRALSEFFELSRQSDQDYEYTVAWIDCLAAGRSLGRGVFMRGNHAALSLPSPRFRRRRIPFVAPVSLVNGLSLRLFNQLYFHRPSARRPEATWHFRPFLYPLDSIDDWNRIYGPRGFFQYQCVVPEADAETALTRMLKAISTSGVGSFLAVLKNFGRMPSNGMLSFPRPGSTLALDFPNRGPPTLALLDSLDAITRAAGGAVYPAKDARMSSAAFQQYFPECHDFARFVDPKFSSSFWRRVMGSHL